MSYTLKSADSLEESSIVICFPGAYSEVIEKF